MIVRSLHSELRAFAVLVFSACTGLELHLSHLEGAHITGMPGRAPLLVGVVDKTTSRAMCTHLASWSNRGDVKE